MQCSHHPLAGQSQKKTWVDHKISLRPLAKGLRHVATLKHRRKLHEQIPCTVEHKIHHNTVDRKRGVVACLN